MEYVLILTLMVGIGNGGNSAQGSGGMTTAEFKDLKSCKSAANKWKKDSEIKTRWSSTTYLTRSALCVKKSITEGE